MLSAATAGPSVLSASSARGLANRTLDPAVVVGPVGAQLGPAECVEKLESPSCLSTF